MVDPAKSQRGARNKVSSGGRYYDGLPLKPSRAQDSDTRLQRGARNKVMSKTRTKAPEQKIGKASTAMKATAVPKSRMQPAAPVIDNRAKLGMFLPTGMKKGTSGPPVTVQQMNAPRKGGPY